VTTLLTNGNSRATTAEVSAQYGFALCPLLHTARRDLALNIGFGTGTTAARAARRWLKRLDVVDLSADILRLASSIFPT